MFAHCQNPPFGFFCPFVADAAHVVGCAQQSSQGSHCPLSSKSPGAAKFNQDAGNWSSFGFSTGAEIHMSLPNGNALILSEEPHGRGRALKEKQDFLLKV